MNLIEFLGRLHPLVVHLPIAFLPLAGLFYLLGQRQRFAFLQKALPITLLLSVLSAIGAVLFGWLLANHGSYDDSTLFWHRWLGIGVLVVALITFAIAANWDSVNQRLLGKSLTVAVILTAITGHLGGSLTHGEDYLTAPLMGSLESKTLIQLPNEKDSINVYQHLIQPVLKEKCYSCHNDTKQNGNLNLATWEGIQKGGDGGKILASDAWHSSLFERVTLSQNSRKFMPPKGAPMTFSEINILKWWINNGAKPKAKLTSFEIKDPNFLEILERDYAIDLSPKPFVETIQIEPLAVNILKELETNGWQVKALAQNNFLLEVSVLKGKTFEKGMLDILSKAKNHITWLNLSDLDLIDDDLQSLIELKNLSRLRIEKNQITNEGLKHLKGLDNLEVLNLYSNPISDKGLDILKEMKGLKRVYLWKTEVTEEGAKVLISGDIEVVLGE